MTAEMAATKITPDEAATLRTLTDQARAAHLALTDLQYALATKYGVRGKDEIDSFGYITRDPALAR
jgi:hypothetical protein